MFVHNPQRKLIARALPWGEALEAASPPTSPLLASVVPAREVDEAVAASSARRFRLPHMVEHAAPRGLVRLPLSARDRADGSRRAAHLVASRELDRSFARQMAGAGVAASVCGLGFAGALAAWTPLPAQIAARALEERGFQIDGVTGSYRSGYRVESVARPGAALGVEMRGLRFRARLRFEGGARVVIDLVDASADSARLTLNEAELRALAEGAALAAIGGKPADAPRAPASAADASLWRARAETIEIGETIVRTRAEDGEEKEHAADRLFVSGLEWGGGATLDLRVERIWLQSGPLDFDAPRFSLSEEGARFADGSFLRARPALAPALLKTEIEARFSGVVRDGAWAGAVVARADAGGQRLGCANAGAALIASEWEKPLVSLCPAAAAPRAVAMPARPTAPADAAPEDPFSESAGPETAESPAAPPPIVRLPAYAPPGKP